MFSANKKKYFGVGIVFIALLILHLVGALSGIENIFYGISIPFLAKMHNFSIQSGDQYQFFRNSSSFIEAYQACVSSTEQAAVTAANFKILTAENNELRAELDFKEKSKLPSVGAEVVGKDISDTNEIVIINQGDAVGIKTDDPVINGNGILVGEVANVRGDVSFVRLLNDDQSRVGATVLNNAGSMGVVEGGYGISLRMDLIPRDEAVLVGDQIITSGLETGIPRGLLIGSVAEVENEPYKPFQQAVLTSATDLSKLNLVNVLLTN